MKMSQIITKLQSLLDAATSTQLVAARVYEYDFPTTVKGDSTVWQIRLIPLPSAESAEYMGEGGWYVPFTVHIEAKRPCTPGNSATDLAASCILAEEILQVIADNRTMTITGETEAAAGGGEGYQPLKWDYGFIAEGETSHAVVNLTATWTGPQITPT